MILNNIIGVELTVVNNYGDIIRPELFISVHINYVTACFYHCALSEILHEIEIL